MSAGSGRAGPVPEEPLKVHGDPFGDAIPGVVPQEEPRGDPDETGPGRQEPAGDPDGADDATLARDLATGAGQLLLALQRDWDGDAAGLRDAGDRRSHELLVGELSRRRPDDAVLSEEGRDDPARLRARRVWIVDPLDGTREFGETRDDWAVHVALWADGDLAAGAVALPGPGLTLSTGEPPVVPPPGGALRMVVSRTRAPAWAAPLADALGARLVPMGSAGAKICAVVRGEADLYVHAGGMYEWDSAAPVAVARAAGLHTSRIDGSLLRYNQPEPWQPDLLVCRPELAGRVLQLLPRLLLDVVGAGATARG